MIDKLIKIQQQLKAPKGQRNTFGNYNYRSCEDILNAVKPLLAAEGLAILLTDDVLVLGDRYYIKATARLVNGDGKGGAEVAAFARESLTKKGMDDSQITGTASSYARKYALNGLFAIDDTKDADTDEHTKQTQGKGPSQKQAEPKQELVMFEGDTCFVMGKTGYQNIAGMDAKALEFILNDKRFDKAHKAARIALDDIKKVNEAMADDSKNT